MNLRSIVMFTLSLSVVSLWGCSDSGVGSTEKKETHKVSGTITMGGGPLVGAAVTFSPLEGQPPALGKTDTAGKYSLTTYDVVGDGAVAGKYTVLVSKSGGSSSAAPTADDVHKAVSAGGAGGAPVHAGPGAASSAGSENLVPSKYQDAKTSPLKTTVEAGKENVLDFPVEP